MNTKQQNHQSCQPHAIVTPKADYYWKVVLDFLALDNNIMMDNNKFYGPTAKQTLAIYLIAIFASQANIQKKAPRGPDTENIYK